MLRDSFLLQRIVSPRDLGGEYSLNILVETDNGRFVARVHGTQTDAARLTSIHLARRHLASHGVPTAEPVPTRDGQPFIDLNGHLVEVERYVEHDAEMGTWRRLELGLPVLGRTHTLLHSIEQEVGKAGRRAPIANHIEPDAALTEALSGVQWMRSWDLTAEERILADSYEELATRVHAAEVDSVSDLPRQLVHGDFWHNNVLFRGDEVVLVADLDFMGTRLRIDDLSLTLFFANSSLGGDRLSAGRLSQLRALVDAYDSGLPHPLSPPERKALPAAIARQPLWSIGRFVPALPEDRARRVAAYRADDVEWTLQVMEHLEEWQEAFSDL